MTPKLIIHGGAGRAMRDVSKRQSVKASLMRHLDTIYAQLQKGMVAKEAVVMGCTVLEDDPLFNAGTGSAVQSDGQIRMSAALMDGLHQQFSGVINVQYIQNPIFLANWLQSQRDRVVDGQGAQLLARQHNLPIYNPMTVRRLDAWRAEFEKGFVSNQASVVDHEKGRGTVGVAVLDAHGQLAVGTSTGGRGFEFIGRISDSATPAGNYANADAAVSCTGIGEDILNASLASRIVVRVTDGFSLHEAFSKSIAECDARNYDLAAIGVSASGALVWGKTSEILLAAYHDGAQNGHTLDLESGVLIGQHGP